MGILIVLMIVLTATMLPFLDKFIAFAFPKGDLNNVDNDCNEVLNEGDPARIHYNIENS